MTGRPPLRYIAYLVIEHREDCWKKSDEAESGTDKDGFYTFTQALSLRWGSTLKYGIKIAIMQEKP
jgi:hypothetical protein